MNQPTTTHSPPRRRRFQFSLRTLFVVITFVAAPLAWVVSEQKQSAREVEIAEQLRESGVRVKLAFLFDLREPKDVPLWRRCLGILMGIRAVHVTGNRSLEDISSLAGLTDLQEIDLNDTQVRDLTPLAGLRNLTRLYLTDNQVRDLTPLYGLKNLEYLFLCGTPVSEEQVNLLQQALPKCFVSWQTTDTD